jgi:hypothetical protein
MSWRTVFDARGPYRLGIWETLRGGMCCEAWIEKNIV